MLYPETWHKPSLVWYTSILDCEFVNINELEKMERNG